MQDIKFSVKEFFSQRFFIKGFLIKDFLIKCEQIQKKLKIWSHLKIF